MRVLDLENLGYQDDPSVLASYVAQVFYMSDPQSNLPPKKKTNHVVAFGKQHIIGVDGVDGVDEYNNYAEIQLFIDFPKKTSVVEKNLSKDILPWERKDVNGKLLRASCSTWSVCVSVCICGTTFMYVCETTFMYVCETTPMYVCETTFMHVCETFMHV